MAQDPLEDAKRILDTAPPEVQRAVLTWLRQRHPIHPIEALWRASAEDILEAIGRAGDISHRGIRGLIAEATFDKVVARGIAGWVNDTPAGNHAYDCRLRRGDQAVTIQVKSQRREAGKPKAARGQPGRYIVETQRTRGGTNADGEKTRPYRFGDFDILAVNMEASTGEWSAFRYTVGKWLLPSPKNPAFVLTMQPVSLAPDDDWTDHLETAIDWHLSNGQRTIQPQSPPRRGGGRSS